jgi:hypothetical protein
MSIYVSTTPYCHVHYIFSAFRKITCSYSFFYTFLLVPNIICPHFVYVYTYIFVYKIMKNIKIKNYMDRSNPHYIDFYFAMETNIFLIQINL